MAEDRYHLVVQSHHNHRACLLPPQSRTSWTRSTCHRRHPARSHKIKISLPVRRHINSLSARMRPSKISLHHYSNHSHRHLQQRGIRMLRRFSPKINHNPRPRPKMIPSPLYQGLPHHARILLFSFNRQFGNMSYLRLLRRHQPHN